MIERSEAVQRCAALLLLSSACTAYAQDDTFTAAQVAAGRTSYQVNCIGCHMADLRGENEARPLTGSDFMNTWRDRTAQQLIILTQATMPPAPAGPGSLGTQAYLELAAFLLAANGASPGTVELTAASTTRIGDVADGEFPAALRTLLADAAPATGPGTAQRPTGVTVAGVVDNYRPVTDAMLRNPDPNGQ
jgi:mono/diheme cytochrome c family protein